LEVAAALAAMVVGCTLVRCCRCDRVIGGCCVVVLVLEKAVGVFGKKGMQRATLVGVPLR
jgi:hypothetical protein